ncbi:MAG TPA: NAD-dependent epimerase/dehydratase family protein [Gemmataceae bacterium]|nr:NAD-dependent epimerase/dehydratase family protein [Gemmataceae bacterium]
MAALVTGASGFVGSHVVETLHGQGIPVRALVRSEATAQPLRDLGTEVYVGDVCQPHFLAEAVRGVDVVYHCAAAVGPAYSPREIHDISLAGVRNLLEALRQYASARAVVLTSVNVLGTRNFDPATEAMPCRRSRDASADVKIEIESLAREYVERHGVDVSILRPGLIYGPRDRHNLPQMVRALKRGKFAFIGSRDNVAPIVYIDDVVEAILRAGRAPASRGRIYHITDGSRTSIGQFIDRLAELVNCPAPRKVLPYAVPYLACVAFDALAALRLYRGRPPITRASLRHLGTSRFLSIERATQELGYVPRVFYQEGLRTAVKWMEEHVHGNDGLA